MVPLMIFFMFFFFRKNTFTGNLPEQFSDGVPDKRDGMPDKRYEVLVVSKLCLSLQLYHENVRMENGTPFKPYRRLTPEEYADAEQRILYEDNHLLVVNKRAGEIVQADKTNDETLTELYKSYIAMRDSRPGSVFIGVPHRLDRPVSGITVLARTSKALVRLNEMFRTGNIHKYYWALVYEAPAEPQGHLSGYIYRNEAQNKSYMCAPGRLRKEARPAELEYRTLCRTERYWLLEIRLLTGRHHQIRCQLSDMGCIIKGDLKYGAPRSNPDGSISLHSRRVNFIHPVRKTEMTIEAPLPPSWKGIPASVLHGVGESYSDGQPEYGAETSMEL